MGERLNGIQEVDGSIPFSSTRPSLSLARELLTHRRAARQIGSTARQLASSLAPTKLTQDLPGSSLANEPVEQKILEIAATVQNAKNQNSPARDAIDEPIRGNDEFPVLAQLQPRELRNHATPPRAPLQSSGSPLQPVKCGSCRAGVSFDQVVDDREEVSSCDLRPINPKGARTHREGSRARALRKTSSWGSVLRARTSISPWAISLSRIVASLNSS